MYLEVERRMAASGLIPWTKLQVRVGDDSRVFVVAECVLRSNGASERGVAVALRCLSFHPVPRAAVGKVTDTQTLLFLFSWQVAGQSILNYLKNDANQVGSVASFSPRMLHPLFHPPLLARHPLSLLFHTVCCFLGVPRVL